MTKHHYRITVEHLSKPHGEPVDNPPLVFETTNHDDLFVIVERMRARADIPAQDAEPLAIGLKLLSEIVLKHRKAPLFLTLHASLGTFIGRLKSASI